MNGKPKICVVGLGGQSVFLSLDHFHAPGETLKADAIYTEPGGKGYNQAVAAARLGAEVCFIGGFGDDDNARSCRAFLENEGIEPVFETIPGEGSAYACILTDREGENRVTVFRGAAERLSGEFIRENAGCIAGCDALLLGLECPPEATMEALAVAKEHNIPVIFNPAPARTLPDELLNACDLITPNRQEASVLFGIEESAEETELAKMLLARGVRAAVTLGSRGSLVIGGGRAFLFPALPVRAVDTTGAGDTFTAALAVCLARGQSLTEAAEYATNASAFCVSRPHVMSALPTADELEKGYRKIRAIEL